MTRALRGTAVLLLFFFAGAIAHAQQGYRAQVARLFEKDSLTIVITDSGLGGLSVCAELEAYLSGGRSVGSVKFVFVNALADAASPYNAMPDKARQLQVFDDALAGMKRWYHPDAILIACNTLSALYPETVSASNEKIPVVSIINVGSMMLAERAKKSGSSHFLILGTPTTIASDIYVKQLASYGIPQDRIVSQSCRLLETEIQADPKSDIVYSLVETYIDEAMEKIGTGQTGKVAVGLCCSHYGYSTAAFEQALRQRIGEQFEIVNPNKAMVALFTAASMTKGSTRTKTSVEVVSKVPFTEQEIASIAEALSAPSLKTAEALRHYELKGDLFPFKK